MGVIAACTVSGAATCEDRTLKGTLARYLPAVPRRTDRLTLQTLLGTAPLKDIVCRDTGLYLAANYPARANMLSLLDAVCVNGRLPKPFEFVNSVSNAASFHVAQQLDLDGPNLFIGAGRQVWRHLAALAAVDLEDGHIRHALLVHCEEDDLGFRVQALVIDAALPTQAHCGFESLSQGVAVTTLVVEPDAGSSAAG